MIILEETSLFRTFAAGRVTDSDDRRIIDWSGQRTGLRWQVTFGPTKKDIVTKEWKAKMKKEIELRLEERFPSSGRDIDSTAEL